MRDAPKALPDLESCWDAAAVAALIWKLDGVRIFDCAVGQIAGVDGNRKFDCVVGKFDGLDCKCDGVDGNRLWC